MLCKHVLPDLLLMVGKLDVFLMTDSAKLLRGVNDTLRRCILVLLAQRSGFLSFCLLVRLLLPFPRQLSHGINDV